MACIYIPTSVVGGIKVILIGLLFSMISFVVTFFFARQTIIDNWGKYKCNPIIIPFAGMFGHDSAQTLSDCMSKHALASTALISNPFASAFKTFSTTMSSTADMVTDMNFMGTGMTNMFSIQLGKIVGQLGNVGSAIQYLIIKIETLLQRIVAVVTVILYTMSSMLQGILALKRDEGLLDSIDMILKWA